ncbi:hypothetical protein [Candidatus Halobonum tyrrellensis]|uniref:Uncharacterized protein n=1 Tax=Candidatus Halobonum tyrrellensis G22 TaxID=1324957 RepID=V4HNF5_9EURY|nr:hypothetical protein [Candidatus Halobonum tyrrellensis]ESP89454.1 hypothetical protein K933_03815 [Candidatus Halobonum tyrrellensis G22]
MAATHATDEESPAVSAHRTSPERTVFTEDGNADGWISTDHTVVLVE